MLNHFVQSHSRLVLVACAALSLGFGNQAFGQLTLVDQTRSITAVAYGDGNLAQPLSNLLDTNLNTGAYSSSLSSGLQNVTVTDPPDDSATITFNSSAGQASLVSPSLLLGTASVSAATSIQPVEGLGWQSNVSGQAIYNVDFTVSTPTPLNLTGEITGTASYHTGPLELIRANVSLSSSISGSLYSVSFAPTGYVYPGESIADPVSYSTILQPGQTYTLDAEADSLAYRLGGVGLTQYDPATAGFSFTAAVPEPTTAFMLPAALLMMRRKRSRLVHT